MPKKPRIYLSVRGYLEDDFNLEDSIAVRISLRGKEMKRVLTGRLYEKFRNAGIFYGWAPFKLNYYDDGRTEVVPLNYKTRKVKLSPNTERLAELEKVKREKILQNLR